MICEVKYSEITADGKLRHPVFLHLREDKNINEVNMANTKPVKTPSTKKALAKEEKVNQKIRINVRTKLTRLSHLEKLK